MRRGGCKQRQRGEGSRKGREGSKVKTFLTKRKNTHTTAEEHSNTVAALLSDPASDVSSTLDQQLHPGHSPPRKP